MGRILGTKVAARFPRQGPVRVFLMGEAPGPLGADQSGLPFWGDRAGLLVYRALAAAGMAEVPEAAWGIWNGPRLKAAGLEPQLRGAALGNAFPRCPTDDGERFRAPKDAELRDPANLARLGAELHEAARRCPGTLRILGLGRRAAWVLDKLEAPPPFQLTVLPHPSAQGLLQAAPDKGRGLRLADLQTAWINQLKSMLMNALNGS
ncbi:MAG TPA: uracil-DNA glycosylase family protein [Holophagaceae bacterium]|nr:uracil-DNA glycosylase family protein [Holophagaceae bacterium]